MTKTAAKRKRPSALDSTLLKTTLALGSVLATYLGADLLASADPASAEVPETAPATQVLEIQGTSNNNGFVLTLDPIPEVVSADQIPRVVVSSRSSG